MFETKIRPYLSVVIIVLLCYLSIFLGVEVFYSYFTFEREIVFSGLSVAFIALPIIMLFPFFYFVIFIFKGKDIACDKMGRYVPHLKWACIVIILCGLLFSILYPRKLLEKGYVRCIGIPSGWMPGTATKYVLLPTMCEHK